MFHGTLTLLARSLRLDALQFRAHSFRFISIAVVFLLLLATHVHTQGRGSPGLQFFALICQLCVGLITVAGAGHFATAITEEKEAGTLNLLILANVPPLAILVGKSTTRIVSVLLVFVGIFPFALLALALGGATAHQVISGLLALAAYLVLVANIGLFASVVRRTGPGAALITIALLLALLATPYAFGRVSRALIAVGWASAGTPTMRAFDQTTLALSELSIITRLERIQKTAFSESAWSSQVVLSLALGSLLFLLSWSLFRRFCEYLGDDVPTRAGVLRVRSGSRRSLWRRVLTPRAWGHALAWKDFNFLVGGVSGLLTRFLLIPLIAIGLFALDRLLTAGADLSGADALRFALLLTLGLEVVSLSGRVFNSEYKRQTLCTLALLPRSTMYLCYSKVAGCLFVVLPFVVWFTLIGALYPIDVNQLADVYLLHPRAIAFGCVWLVLTHLTAWLSLYVKWGALPLATMLLMVVTSCVSPFIALAAAVSRDGSGTTAQALLPVVYLTFIACGGLQIAIGLRFRRAAAE